MKVPDAIRKKSDTYSAYKSYNTFKVMIGVAPNGVINYVSPVYGGNASDRHIVQRSGILKEFVTGELIVADNLNASKYNKMQCIKCLFLQSGKEHDCFCFVRET